MTDNYQFEKSNTPESIGSYSPFTNKQWNSVSDINSGVYQSTGLTQVSWDLSSIFNTTTWTDVSEHYITLPIVLSAGYGQNNSAVALAPGASGFSLLSMKSNFINLIHQADLGIAGKNIEQAQNYLNIFQNFRMISEMSQNDLKTLGTTIGFSDCIDTPNSVVWNGAVNVAGVPNGCQNGGNGLCNNFAFPVAGSLGTDTQLSLGAQNTNVINKAIQQRVSKIVDTTATTNKIIGTTQATNTTAGNLTSPIQLNNEFKGQYSVVNNIMTWSDVAVIKVGDIFDSMKQLGMLKKFDGILRLYLNLGMCFVNVTGANSTAVTYQFQQTNSTFVNTIPFTINYMNGTTANNGLPTLCTSITASLTLIRPPTTNYTNGTNIGSNLALSGYVHPLASCKYYYSQITMSPELDVKYAESNRNKKVVYRTMLSNNFNTISPGASFSQLVNGGIKNMVGVLIIPLISASFLNYPEYISPFDTFGATYTPLSLTNINASLGGPNFLMNPQNYNYEEFLTQVSEFESLTCSDWGVSVGLINQQWWENNRVYYLAARSDDTGKSTPRALTVSFNNNNLVPIDVMVFTIYLDEFVVDVLSGRITK